MKKARLIDTPYGLLTFKQIEEKTGLPQRTIRNRYLSGKKGAQLVCQQNEFRKQYETKKETDNFMSWDAIAKELRISKPTVLRCYKSALAKMRNNAVMDQYYLDSGL